MEEEKISLRNGKLSNAEIAEWLGIKTETFSKRKSHYMSKINGEYADFEIYKGGVMVSNIKRFYYEKSNPKFEKIKEETQKRWDKSGLDTCKRVSESIYKDYHSTLNLTSISTYTYTTKSKKELWGIPHISRGSAGSCRYEICKLEGDRYIPLTQEENEIKKALLTKYFGDSSEKQLYVEKMVRDGEIAREEAWDIYSELVDLEANYQLFVSELQIKLNCIIRRATRVENDFKE